MSGGVDSSVAAALLVESGHDVTGAFMINFDDANNTNGDLDNTNNNCWRPDYRDALRVAAKLGIPLLKLDFQEEYKEMVLEYMYAEYEKGRTPNPDVMCNKFVKFGVWLDKVQEMGFDKLATGHYAVLRITDNTDLRITNCELLIAKDKNKDQTYFLNQLNQEQLSHTLFPLGEYTKDEVRGLAKKFDLPTADKEESMGICFVGEVDMKDFLKKEIDSKPGNIVMSSGEVVGEHEGLAFYTIGQRHLGQLTINNEQLTNQEPLYVVNKRFEINELVVGGKNDELLWKKEIRVSDVNWIAGLEPDFPLQCEIRLRHRQELQNAECRILNDELIFEFEEPQRAVTPGQFAVFYKDGVCLGGGIIE